MYHKQLVEHIIHKQASGVSDDDIRAELIADEWSNKDIDLSFQYAKSPEKLQHFSLGRLLQSEVKAIYFVVLFLLSLGLSVTQLVYSDSSENTYTLTITDAPESTKQTFTYGMSPALSQPDFFNTVKNQLIESKVTFVEADLTHMIVRVYKNGVSVVEVPVKTKGKSGSWWETPAGLYKIETKEKTHYSTMGHVTQPWSMQFQGNFYIHGIPYYDDGTPVASTFSGGCIRLENSDAKKIFDQVAVGVPILVYEKDFSPDSFLYSEIKPSVRGEAFMYADINNNFVFLKNKESHPAWAGSITKLMTALVATEYINIEKPTVIPESALVETSVPRLRSGMKTDIYQLLFPLLRESSNEAGEAIALSYGRSQFIKQMNKKARAIGMTHTTFVDPTGVSKENISTAEDMFMLAKYIYNNRSFIFNITSGKVRTDIYGKSIFSDMGSSNGLSLRSDFFGGIAGSDASLNEHNLSVLEMQTSSGIRPIFFVSLSSKDAKRDVIEGLEYVRSRYK